MHPDSGTMIGHKIMGAIAHLDRKVVLVESSNTIYKPSLEELTAPFVYANPYGAIVDFPIKAAPNKRKTNRTPPKAKRKG